MRSSTRDYSIAILDDTQLIVHLCATIGMLCLIAAKHVKHFFFSNPKLTTFYVLRPIIKPWLDIY